MANTWQWRSRHSGGQLTGRRLGRWLVVGWAVLLVTVASAQAQIHDDGVGQQQQRLKSIKFELDWLTQLPQQTLTTYLNQVTEAEKTANSCIQEGRTTLEPVTAHLKTLGPAVKGEAADLTAKRTSLEQNKAQIEQQLDTCRLLLVDSQELAERITTLQKTSETEYLLTRSPSVLSIIRANLDNPANVWLFLRVNLLAVFGITALSRSQTITLSALLLLGVVVGIGGRRKLLHYAQQPLPDASLAAGLRRALLACGGRSLPLLAPSILSAAYLTWQYASSTALVVITQMSYGVTTFVALTTVIRTLLAPRPPADPFLPLPTALAAPLSRRLRVLVLLLIAGFIGPLILTNAELPISLVLLIGDAFLLLLVVNLLWIVTLLGQLPVFSQTLRSRLALGLGLLMGLGAGWVGYPHLATFIIRGIVMTVVGLSLSWLLARLCTELYNTVDAGQQHWASQLRLRLGVKAGEPMPGLVWLRVLTALMLWSGCILFILVIWDLVPADSTEILEYFTQPFTIGAVHFAPVRLPLALMSFFVATSLISWLKKRMEQQWLLRTHLDRGAREAVVTISGYVGLLAAALITLSVLGLGLGNLALVAGALSLGIGFGLQNIVNNFVSGIILLFERPIKTGDWVQVGNTQGHVRKISIRSTRIQTFDYTDVIVPNSRLIAEQVTNWTLQDNIGRLRLPVGVAYGSDTARVKQILLEMANAHQSVVKNHPFLYPPKVLFVGFGDSALNFELWCFIHDINSKWDVISDLNFAMDAAFREVGIEIPFPQRDLHLRTAHAPIPPEHQKPASADCRTLPGIAAADDAMQTK